MTGTIAELERSRGVGSLRGDDGKTYLFRRADVRDCWFHDLTVGQPVSFVPGTGPRALTATEVRLQRAPGQ